MVYRKKMGGGGGRSVVSMTRVKMCWLVPSVNLNLQPKFVVSERALQIGEKIKSWKLEAAVA